MKFTYLPNVTVMDFLKGKKIFQFDNKGEFVTEDEKIIEWTKKNKSFIKCEDNVIEDIEELEEVKEIEIKEVETIETTIYNCKKCEFETDNKGLLMAHYRSEHKKVK